MLETIIMTILNFIVLAIGFTTGYWLITAAGREERWKRALGAIFGWVLILYSIVVSVMICFQMYMTPVSPDQNETQPEMQQETVPDAQ